MSFVPRTFSATETVCQPGSRTANALWTACPPISRYWDHTPRSPVPFATDSLGRRKSSSMASDPLNPSEADVREHNQHRSAAPSREGTPYAARAAAGAAAASTFFPLGYREGFSQWVSCQLLKQYSWRHVHDNRANMVCSF